ncbi:hypothetical protein TcasGA2_TC034099 [Tribolium castaneum]|uniref:Uncharacterized protein n=1 Tax=Tribolium castaneum TaxID=7070 RepID=A0A139WD86_TRICA|nr:hypothetical protein TcasGA2_TC034099 [Tribolium castaneum]
MGPQNGSGSSSVCDVSLEGGAGGAGRGGDPPFMHHGTAVRDNDFFVNYQVAYEGGQDAHRRLRISIPPPKMLFFAGRVYASLVGTTSTVLIHFLNKIRLNLGSFPLFGQVSKWLEITVAKRPIAGAVPSDKAQELTLHMRVSRCGSGSEKTCQRSHIVWTTGVPSGTSRASKCHRRNKEQVRYVKFLMAFGTMGGRATIITRPNRLDPQPSTSKATTTSMDQRTATPDDGFIAIFRQRTCVQEGQKWDAYLAPGKDNSSATLKPRSHLPDFRIGVHMSHTHQKPNRTIASPSALSTRCAH